MHVPFKSFHEFQAIRGDICVTILNLNDESMKENATPSSLDGPLHGGFSKFLVNGKRPIRHAMVGDKALWWHECVQPPLLLRKNRPLAAQLKPPFGHSCYWAAHRVGPVITSAFGRLCRKTITRGSEDTRSGTKKRCSQHLFHTIFPSKNIFCTSHPLPPPKEAQKGLRINKAICVDRSDSTISLTIERSHFISFFTVLI